MSNAHLGNRPGAPSCVADFLILWHEEVSELSLPILKLLNSEEFQLSSTLINSDNTKVTTACHCQSQFSCCNFHFWNVTLIPYRFETFLTWSRRKDTQQKQVFQTWDRELTATEGDWKHTLFFLTQSACGNLIRANTHETTAGKRAHWSLEQFPCAHCDRSLRPTWGLPCSGNCWSAFLPLFVHIAQCARSPFFFIA